MSRPLLAFFVSLAFSLSAHAAPSYRATLSSARNLRKSEVRLAKSIAALSAADRERLKTALRALGVDSDSDGVSDIFEKARGSGLCDSDTDDDGIDDRDDDYEKDEDRTGEVESKGSVTSFEDPTLIVGGKTFTITSSTRFRRGVSSKEDLAVGVCVKVEGYAQTSGGNVATKVEGYSRCSGGDDGDDD